VKVKKEKKTEKDLAAVLIRYLQDMGWEIYQEVQIFSFDKRADIVAVRDNITWIIETKMGMGLEVIQQAYAWRMYANYISVAVPARLRTRTMPFGCTVSKMLGIGVLTCGDGGVYYSGIKELERPKLCRQPLKHLRQALVEEHKTYAEAGNSEGKFWSPFKATCERIKKAVEKRPGMTLKELVESVEHHYSTDSTARGSIVQWARMGKIPGIEIDEHCRPMRVYPEGQVPKPMIQL
jgi:hypothetical protein